MALDDGGFDFYIPARNPGLTPSRAKHRHLLEAMRQKDELSVYKEPMSSPDVRLTFNVDKVIRRDSNRVAPDAVEHLDQMAFNDVGIQEVEVACVGLGRNVGINEVRTENLLVDVSQQQAAERSLLVLCAREDEANRKLGLLCGTVPLSDRVRTTVNERREDFAGKKTYRFHVLSGEVTTHLRGQRPFHRDDLPRQKRTRGRVPMGSVQLVACVQQLEPRVCDVLKPTANVALDTSPQ